MADLISLFSDRLMTNYLLFQVTKVTAVAMVVMAGVMTLGMAAADIINPLFLFVVYFPATSIPIP
jgi:hypothetical protein